MDENATPSHHAVPDDRTTFVVEYLQHPQSFFHSPSLPCPPDNEERGSCNEKRNKEKRNNEKKNRQEKQTLKYQQMEKTKKRKETKLRTSKLMSHTIHV